LRSPTISGSTYYFLGKRRFIQEPCAESLASATPVGFMENPMTGFANEKVQANEKGKSTLSMIVPFPRRGDREGIAAGIGNGNARLALLTANCRRVEWIEQMRP
jgi:hypothetical protein